MMQGSTGIDRYNRLFLGARVELCLCPYVRTLCVVAKLELGKNNSFLSRALFFILASSSMPARFLPSWNNLTRFRPLLNLAFLGVPGLSSHTKYIVRFYSPDRDVLPSYFVLTGVPVVSHFECQKCQSSVSLRCETVLLSNSAK